MAKRPCRTELHLIANFIFRLVQVTMANYLKEFVATWQELHHQLELFHYFTYYFYFWFCHFKEEANCSFKFIASVRINILSLSQVCLMRLYLLDLNIPHQWKKKTFFTRHGWLYCEDANASKLWAVSLLVVLQLSRGPFSKTELASNFTAMQLLITKVASSH